jgi:hypothetical protein
VKIGTIGPSHFVFEKIETVFPVNSFVPLLFQSLLIRRRMVMQTVRSRSNSSVLPYYMKDLKKLESPTKIESPLRTRQLLDRTFCSDLGASSPQARATTRAGSPLQSMLQRTEATGTSSAHWLVVLALLVGTLFVGSLMTNEALNQKVADLERLREQLKDTQASINAQLNRNTKRRIPEESPDPLEGQVATLMSDIERLDRIIQDERKATQQAKQEIELQKERTKGIEVAHEKREQDLMTAIQKMARMKAIDE